MDENEDRNVNHPSKPREQILASITLFNDLS